MVGAVLSVTMLVTVITTFSRGALLALVAVVGAMAYRHRANRTVLAVALGLGLVTFIALPAEYTARITALTGVVSDGGAAGAADPSGLGRASEMPAAVQMFADRPLGGVGHRNYPQLYQDYSAWIGLDPRREPREAHSLYLEVASETGMLGLGVLTIGLALARARIVRGRRQLQAGSATHGLLMLDALGLALTAFLITSVFLHGAYPRVFWLLLGLALIAPWPVRFRAMSDSRVAP
jgi:O-antigen ligase